MIQRLPLCKTTKLIIIITALETSQPSTCRYLTVLRLKDQNSSMIALFNENAAKSGR